MLPISKLKTLIRVSQINSRPQACTPIPINELLGSGKKLGIKPIIPGKKGIPN
jgi:hypothetical protein